MIIVQNYFQPIFKIIMKFFVYILRYFYRKMIPLPPVVPLSPLMGIGPPSAVQFYLNLVVAAVTLFYYSDIDPSLRPIDIPTNLLNQEYDFIIVGGGSAGI